MGESLQMKMRMANEKEGKTTRVKGLKPKQDSFKERTADNVKYHYLSKSI